MDKKRVLVLVPHEEKFTLKRSDIGYYIFDEAYQALKTQPQLDVRLQSLYPLYEKRGREGFHLALCDLARQNDVLIFVFTSKPFYDADAFRRIKGASPSTYLVSLHGDDALAFPHYSAGVLDGIDLIVAIDSMEIARAHIGLGRNAVFLPGFVPSSIFRPLGIEKDIPVSFVGSMATEGRREAIAYARDRGLSVECFGSGTANGFVDLNRYVDVINRSQINIVFTEAGWGDALKYRFPRGYRVPRQFKGKIVEIMLCQTFALVQHFDELEESFEIGKNLVTFRSAEEMVEKAKYYLHHAEERDALAKAGYQHAMACFESAAQGERLTRLILDRQPGESVWPRANLKRVSHIGTWPVSRRIDPGRIVEWRLIMALQFLRRRQLGPALQELRALALGRPPLTFFRQVWRLAKRAL